LRNGYGGIASKKMMLMLNVNNKKSKCVAVICFIILMAGCSGLKPKAEVENWTSHAWATQPPAPVDQALSKALAFLAEQKQDLTCGYTLEAGRVKDYWYFHFDLLPYSPDLFIIVRIHDSGEITSSALAPPRN
jgi:hypothetical protein